MVTDSWRWYQGLRFARTTLIAYLSKVSTGLQADVQADRIVFDKLRACGAVATASSEEQSDMLDMGGSGFSVCIFRILEHSELKWAFHIAA